MELTLDEIQVDPVENDRALAEKLATEIAALKSRITYPATLRTGFIGALVGKYFGGWPGFIIGALAGGFIGHRIQPKDIDVEVIHNQIREKQRELEAVVKRGNLEDAAINGIMSSADLANFQYDAYPFDGKWEALYGEPSKGFHCMIYGRPKQGKSILAVQMANYVTGFGKVLYVAAEEGFSKTLQNKVQEFGMESNNLDFANFRDYNAIKEALDLNAYQFVFLDSVNFMKLSAEEIEALKRANPHTSFVTIHQATKDGQFRGSQEYAHNCDMIVQVEAGIAHQQGRFKEPSAMAIFDAPKDGIQENNPVVATEDGASPETKKRGRPAKRHIVAIADEPETFGMESDY